MINAFVSNAQHPEFGDVMVPLPIPSNEYESILDLLKAMEFGDAVQQDCHVEKMTGSFSILKRLQGSQVNLDELDYLAKRLDSFDAQEKMEFKASAVRLGVAHIQDFINLTFCCQQATVVTDFSDLESIGKRHYLTVHGGSAPVDEFEKVDGRRVALDLIQNHDGHITPYGVVYDNGMKLEQVYDGRHFPAYDHDTSLIALTITPKTADQESPAADHLYLPAPDSLIERTFLRSGLAPCDLQYSIEYESLPEAVSDAVDIARENVLDLNNMCRAIRELDSREMDKLSAAVLLAKPESAFEVGEIAKNLELFDFIPGIRDAEEYGQYMIRESGHFEYDPNLDNFYNYSQYGWDRINREQGQFNGLGYIVYMGTMTMEELLCGDPVERMDQQMGGM